MPRGSVVLYLGGTWHGSGANTSSSVRHGLNIDYNLAWLRQEENQYLSVPPNVAKDMPVEMQKLVGYTLYSDALGYFANFQHPREAFPPVAVPKL